MSLSKFVTRKRATWALTASFLILSAAQPTAQGLDFPTTTRLNLPEGPAAKITITKDIELGQAVIAPISEMAKVAAMARQVELARKPTGARYVARTIMSAEYSWGDDQYSCLNRLWTKESHWNYKAHNSRSGAHGIPQSLPASKMEVVGTDWRTNPVTQIRWGLRYIESRYSTPCKAWAKFQRSKYY
jgi:hypothetical protein